MAPPRSPIDAKKLGQRIKSEKSLQVRILIGFLTGLALIFILIAIGIDDWQEYNLLVVILVKGLYHGLNEKFVVVYGFPTEPSRIISLILIVFAALLQIGAVVNTVVFTWKNCREKVLNQYIAITSVNFAVLLLTVLEFGIWTHLIDTVKAPGAVSERISLGTSFSLAIAAMVFSLLNLTISILVKMRIIDA